MMPLFNVRDVSANDYISILLSLSAISMAVPLRYLQVVTPPVQSGNIRAKLCRTE